MARVAEKAYVEIRYRILRGEYVAGSRLREEELASRFDVSRTPIREALRRLDAEGLVEFSPNRGAQVAAWPQQDLEEIFGLRALLEGFGASLAARKITAAELERLEELAADMERMNREGADLEDLTVANNEFHMLVVGAAGNKRLIAAVNGVVQVPLKRETLRSYDGQQVARSMAQHRDLIAALHARDPERAQSIMRAHVLGARYALAAR